MIRSVALVALSCAFVVLSTGCGEHKRTSTTKNSKVLDVAPVTAVDRPIERYSYEAAAPSDSTTYATAVPTVSPVMLTSTPTTISPAAPVATTPAVTPGSKYKVKPGDTLFGIARASYGDGKQWNRIASANPGLSPQSLKAGQTITVP